MQNIGIYDYPEKEKNDLPHYGDIQDRVQALGKNVLAGNHYIVKDLTAEETKQMLTRWKRALGATPENEDVRHIQGREFDALLSLYWKDGHEWGFSGSYITHSFKDHLPYQGDFHRHDYIEILYVVQGTFRQLLLGNEVEIREGRFLITDRGAVHADLIYPEDCAVLFLEISTDLMDRLLQRGGDNELRRFLFHALKEERDTQSFLSLEPERDPVPQLSFILEQLVCESLDAGPWRNLIVEGYLQKLFDLMVMNYSLKVHGDERARERAALYEIERYIRMHPEACAASDLEAHFHYQRNYYNQILRRFRGVTFRQYTADVRMERAASLLDETALSVRDIAGRCGYENISHFYHLFERKYGISPTQYRKRIAKNQEKR